MNAPAKSRASAVAAVTAPAPAPVTAAAPVVGWLKPLRDWPQALLRALEDEPAVVRILVTQVLGSAPREAGVSMLVGRERWEGTIGGGQLEWQAIAAARALLTGSEPARGIPSVRLQRIVLAADVAQCCGGVVQLWLQRYTRSDRAVLRAARDAALDAAGDSAHGVGAVLISTVARAGVEHQIVSAVGVRADADQMLQRPRADALPRVSLGTTAIAASATAKVCDGDDATPAVGTTLVERLDHALPAVWLYGAGHVGQALARMSAELPLELCWIDSRAQLFPQPLPDAVRSVHAPDPVSTVASAAVGTHFLVLTHSHALDYALCRAILARGDAASLGLIGSRSKAARFRSRLLRDGLSPDSIARLRCPIGAGAIASKWPAAIAVAIAFDLLREFGGDAVRAQQHSRPANAHAASAAGCGTPDCASCRPARID
jgi:xanthine dehydrogenase accessory factor